MRSVGLGSVRIGRAVCCAIVFEMAALPVHGNGWNPDTKQNNAISADSTNLDAPSGHVPAIASSGSDVAIAFSVARGTAGQHRAYAQLISHGGVTMWSAGGVRLATSESTQINPAIVTDGAGGAIVVWQDDRFGDWDIFAQRVLADGSLAWDANGLCVDSEELHQLNPVVASDGVGGAIVAWDGGQAQRLGPDGSLLWTSTCHSAVDFDQSDAERLRIVGDGAQGAIISWNWPGFVGGRGMRIGPDGTNAWANSVPFMFHDPLAPHRLISDGSGGAIALYIDAGAGDLWVNRLDATGSQPWGTNGVKVPDYDGSRPLTSVNSVALAPCRNQGDAGAFITWAARYTDSDTTPQSCTYSVKALPVTSTGSFTFQPYAKTEGTTTVFGSGISCGGTESPILGLAIASLGSQALIAWANVDGNVYAQRIRADGSLIWPDPVTVSNAPWTQSYPVVATSHAPLSSLTPSCFVVSWNDTRRSPFGLIDDVYASAVDGSGVGCSSIVLSKAPLWMGAPSPADLAPIGKTIVVENEGANPVSRNLALYADQSVVDSSKGYKKVTGLFRFAGGGAAIMNPIVFPPGRTVLRLEISAPSVLTLVNRTVGSVGSVNLPVGVFLDDPAVDSAPFVVEADPDADLLVGGSSSTTGLRRRAGSDDDGSAESYAIVQAPTMIGDVVCSRFAATLLPSAPYAVTGFELVGGEFGGSGLPGLDAVELRSEDPIYNGFPDLTNAGLMRSFGARDGIGSVPTGPPPTLVKMNITDIHIDPTGPFGLVPNLFVCAATLVGDFSGSGGTAIGVDQTPETLLGQSMVIDSGILPGTYDRSGNYMLRLFIDGDRATIGPGGVSRETLPANPSAGVYQALRK